MSRQLSDYLKQGEAPTRMLVGTVTAFDGSSRNATVTLSTASVKVWVPSSLGTLAAGDKLYILSSGHHMVPFAFHR